MAASRRATAGADDRPVGTVPTAGDIAAPVRDDVAVGRRGAHRLVGREGDVQQVVAALTALEAGEGGVLLVQGEPGIGKTRLLDEADRLLRGVDFPVVVGRAGGIDLAGGAVPYGLLYDLLLDLDDSTEPARPQLLAEHRSALAHVLPGAGTATPGGLSNLDRVAVFAAVRQLLQELTRHCPVVLLIDDLHWADSPSLEVLTYLAEVFSRRQLLAILAFRPPSNQDARQAVAQLARSARADILVLAPLTDEQVIDQLQQITGSDPSNLKAQQIATLSGGIPLYVEELAVSGSATQLPVRLELALGNRLSGASAGVRQILGAAALHPRPVDATALAQVTGSPRPEVLAALSQGVELGLLEPPTDGTYPFHHALLRQAVADALTPAAKEESHRAWAQWFEGLQDAGGPTSSSIIAYHWFQSGDVEQAIPAAARAGAEAHRLGSMVEASTHWRNALALWSRTHAPDERAGMDRDTLVVMLDEAYNFSGRWEQNRQLLDEEERRSAEDPVKHLWIRLRRERVHDSLGLPWSPAVAPEDQDDLLTELEAIAGSAPSRLVENCLIMLGEMDPSAPLDFHLRRVDAIQEVAKQAGDHRLQAIGLGRAAKVLHGHGDLAGALDAARAAVRMMEGFSPVDADWIRAELIVYLTDLGQIGEAITESERALSGRTEATATGPVWELALSAAYACMMAGKVGRARELLEPLTRHASDRERAEAQCWLTAVDLIQGHLDEAEDLIQQTETLQTSNRYVRQALGAVRGWLSQCRNDVSAARGALLPSLTITGDYPTWVMLMLATRRHEADAPLDWLEALETAALRLSHDGPVTAATRAQVTAHLAALTSENDCDLWSEAVALWATVGYPDPEAWCRLRYASALMHQRRFEEAEHQLRAIVASAAVLGCELLADEAMDMARRARLAIGPTRRPSTAETILTSREQEVLTLIARGKTNHEIATDLFISPKTASVHVSRILQKLGAANRTEAAWQAHQLGLD